MRKLRTRWKWLLAASAVLALAPVLVWTFLLHQPDFYRQLIVIPPEKRDKQARRFLNQSLQLRNDIINEKAWEAVFSAEEINSWLAEDLLKHFADLVPNGLRDPRVAFEPDRLMLAFEMDQGPLRSVVWAVLLVEVTRPNVVSLTIEKLRAGALPVPPEQVLGDLVAHARRFGLDVDWSRENGKHVIELSYEPQSKRKDIRLDQVQIFNGSIRLHGHSEPRAGEQTTLRLPDQELLQSRFPRRKVQQSSESSGRGPVL